jgi:hypothetical protein
MVASASRVYAEGCGGGASPPRSAPPVLLEGEERIIMTMDRGTAVHPMTGQRIYTSDGDHLGTVKELRGEYFKVDAPMQPDYWLRCDCAAMSAGDRITLAFDKHQLGDYKVSDPNDADVSRDTGARSRMGTYTETTVPAGLTGFTAGMWDEAKPTYRDDWERRYGTSGRRWEDAEPGYRYGYEMGRDPRYSGRQWADVESDLGTGYSSWCRDCGYGDEAGGWDRMKESARESWDRVRGERQ